MRRILIATAATALVLAACGTDEPEAGSAPVDTEQDDGDGADDVEDPDGPADDEADGFPVDVTDDRGADVTIEQRPERIVSLSATHTEVLFAIGAGEQVIAVDEISDHPEAAPTTDLSGFDPNLEAIADQDPDLVIIAFDPGDLADGLEGLGIPVVFWDAPVTIDGAFEQWEQVGTATGNADAAADLVSETRTELEALVADTPDTAAGMTYYHELDEYLFTSTSSSFIGDVYGLFGLENVADAADEDGTGFPQLSDEYLFEVDPDLMFLAAAVYGQSADVVAARPGWDTLTAVQEGNLIELDPDLSSRWGPRIVEFAEIVATGIGAAVDVS